MKKTLTCIILSIIIFINTTFTCYASETVSNLLSWSSIPDKIKEWSNIPLEQKLMMFYNTVAVNSGIVPDGKISKASLDYWLEYCLGKQEKTVADMTEKELDALLETYYGKLKEKGTGFNSKGEFVTSDTVINDYRTFFNDYSKDNLQSIYRTVKVPCVGEKTLTALMCGSKELYDTITFFVNKFGDCAVYYYGANTNRWYICPLGSYGVDYFSIYNSDYTVNNHKCTRFILYDSECENNIYNCRDNTYYSFKGADLTSAITSIDDSRLIPTTWSAGYDYSYDFAPFTFNKSTNDFKVFGTLVTKDKGYIKVFNTVSDYQKYYISPTDFEPNVYYTSNYYKTENIQESAIPLEQMVNLYNCYDELCQKVLQYVKDTQNADDTAVIKKLDELIKAVYSTGSVSGGGSSGGSTDVDVNVDMTETNNILTQILEIVKKIANKEIIELPNNTAVDDWGNTVKDMLVNPDTAINNTVNNLASSLSAPFDKLKEKFPFSIPWDIAFLITFLADTPDTPKFDIPIKFESYNIDYTLTIDFASFEVVSKISRMLLTLCYMVALIQLTSKVSDIKKGD